MTPARLNTVFGTTVALLRDSARPDAELLTAFLDCGDERAFQTLLVRHTPAVRAACRGWLRRDADVDDATQATFLVLVQRGRSIRNPAALGPWLYRVAANVARRLRQQQPAHSPMPADVPGREPAGDHALRDLLDEEVARLPEKYRLPVQLCYTAGLTTVEAAQQLGWPKGTVLTRLAWARQRLQKCLVRRGVAPSVFPALLVPKAGHVVSAAWLHVTTLAAQGLLAGEELALFGVSARTVSLTQGVVRAMVYDRIKYVLLAALVAVSLAGLGLHRWASVSANPGDDRGSKVSTRDRDADPVPQADRRKEAPKIDEARPVVAGRRREAVIRVPTGSFVKEVDAAPHGSGRITWTYEDERVVGLIEGSVMGVQFALATEAEFSLSSNGTIYGVLTSLRLDYLDLADLKELGELKPFLGLWPLVEPLLTEMTTDLPFSYKFRVQGDRLVISDFRMLLAGPNPVGKLGGILGADKMDGVLMPLAVFQGLGTAIEGTYLTAEAREKLSPAKRSLFLKRRGEPERKSGR